METTLESQRLGSGEDNGNVAGGGVETKQETKGVETTLET